ncbi:hypothetical protein BRADI_5g13942v3 [Brachypodium distachyon]|uniref:F-box domain-containing protein n=1 Tax=Brachypodium distachyon TaxID=15368 RepID=A0A2K2CH22_BRADI|nr:hypothetical protein BRADI_5g13942v3 [Brachypodium distachyon]
MAAVSDARSKGVDQEEHWISKLPDDVLVSVLNRLDVRCAVRSGILSRQWRHLPVEIPNIVLDVEDYELTVDEFKSTLSDKARDNMAVAKAARTMLRPLRVLRLGFYVVRVESAGIVGAVDDAIAHGCSIAKAAFEILADKTEFMCKDKDLTRHATSSCLTSTLIPTPSPAWSLHLESVKLGQSDISSVLATYEMLESFSLLNCDAGRHTVLALEYRQITALLLVMCRCDSIELKWLSELVKLTCESWLTSQSGEPLLFGHVPLLGKLALSTNCNFLVHNT